MRLSLRARADWDCAHAVLLVAHGLPLQPCVQKVHVPRGGEGGAADGGDGDAAEEEEVVLAAGGGLLAPTEVPRKQAAQGAPAVGIGADNAGLPVATLRCAQRDLHPIAAAHTLSPEEWASTCPFVFEYKPIEPAV